MEADGDQVSPTISLLCKSPLTKILKEIKNLIKDQTFLVEDQNEGEPVIRRH